MAPERRLTVRQAADQLGCNPETIRRAIRFRELLAVREPTKRGRGYTILATDLKDFIQKRSLA